jgi:adenosylcobinamide-GDP ribazoletransferase
VAERPRLLDEPALAVAFLTVLPVRVGPGAVDLGRAAAWFPLVGAVVGLAAGGAYAGVEALAGSGPAAVAALVVLVVLTGGLHQDGLADTADGLGARGGDRARRLEVMRDSATGAFGTLALIAWALAAYAALTRLDAGDAALALGAAGAASRWAALAHAAALPPARADGLGAGFAIGPATVALGGVPALVLAMVLCGAAEGAGALVAAAASAGLVALLARRTLGGRTGDTLGAAVALAEVAVLVVLAA